MALSLSNITTASNVAWDTGDLFDGFLILKLIPPDGRDNVVWEHTGFKAASRFILPIVAGVLSTAVEVPYNTDFTPPNSQYRDFWFDKTLTQIATGSGFFTITADPHSITVPTLTAPVVEPTLPVLDADAVTVVPSYGSLVPESVAGTKDGANTAFTVSRDSAGILLFLNGQLLFEGTGFSKSTTAITAIAPYIPESGDTYVAVLI